MLRLGIAHHFGWAVAVVASADSFEVVDRRRIELVEPGTPVAPIHTDGVSLDDAACARLVADVRASARRATSAALDSLPSDIVSISLRAWDDDFPTDIAVLRQVPWEARADSVMYREVLAECARERGWDLCFFDAKGVESAAATVLGARADDVLTGPRARLGPPWAKDHRLALAAIVLASG